MLSQAVMNGLISGVLYILAALGFSLVYYTTRVFHIAFAALLVGGNYCILIFIRQGLPFFVSLILAAVIMGVLHALTDILIYQPMTKRGNSTHVMMVASIGVYIVLVNVVAMLFGNERQLFNNTLTSAYGTDRLLITGNQLSQLIVASISIAASLLILFYTRAGLYIRSFRDDGELLTTFGIDIRKIRLAVFFGSGVLATLASGLMAYDVGFTPYNGLPFLLNAIIAIIIGGIGSFSGIIWGGLVFGALQGFSVWLLGSRWEALVTFGVLLLFLLFKPGGIMGKATRNI